jgi:hypothetical protein
MPGAFQPHSWGLEAVQIAGGFDPLAAQAARQQLADTWTGDAPYRPYK